MKATIYPFKSNLHGYYVQWDTPTKVIEPITKKELMAMADLRHPVSTKNEFYQTLSTDINGLPKKEFQLLGDTFLIIVSR